MKQKKKSFIKEYIDTADSIRERMTRYITDKHISLAEAARQVKMNNTSFYMFIMGYRETRITSLSKIDKFLYEKGY